MIVYWALLAFFSAGALLGTRADQRSVRSIGPLFVLGLIAMVILIGLRWEVGADWRAYDYMFDRAARLNFWEAIAIGDPGYQIVNWVAAQAGGDVWLVNLLCAAIFTWGLARFCSVQPDPWTAMAVAVPYLVIVVAMGYSRQAVALGVLAAGIASFLRGTSVLKFAVYVFVAALFHRTAVVAFPLVALAAQRNRFINLLVAIAASVLLYDLFLGESMDEFVSRYIRTAYASQGAAIRVAMNLLVAGVFWMAAGRLGFQGDERKLWRNFSLAAVLMLALLLALPSSTAVDRMSLYILPLQVAVLGRLPTAFGGRGGTVAALGYSFLILFVWLNFAQHARYWIPYQFVPF